MEDMEGAVVVGMVGDVVAGVGDGVGGAGVLLDLLKQPVSSRKALPLAHLREHRLQEVEQPPHNLPGLGHNMDSHSNKEPHLHNNKVRTGKWH